MGLGKGQKVVSAIEIPHDTNLLCGQPGYECQMRGAAVFTRKFGVAAEGFPAMPLRDAG